MNDRVSRLIASPILWGALLVLGIAARTRQYLFAHSYWYDESFLLLPIRERSYADLLGPQPYNLVIPPFFLWITRALHEIGGDGELIMRLPSFVAGVGALLLMIPLARRVVGGVHAVWAFALLALCRHAMTHGSETRPYTVDLLIAESILLCAATLIDSAASRRTVSAAMAGLGLIAAVGPWLSFPSAFLLGGASLALAVHLGRSGPRWAWLAWVGFNATVAASAALLWYFSGRHMYYSGMIEHWGHQGWNGFPDWQSPAGILKWVITRPIDVGNYGTRELGVVLYPLAMIGAIAAFRRSRALGTLLLTPVLLALAAGLMGKYPVAHRTGFFLLPCLWLFVALGVGQLVDWGRQRSWNLAFVGLVLITWDAGWAVFRCAVPDGNLDYRGGFEYVRDHRQPNDLLWTEMPIVHETYYGKPSYLVDDDIAIAEKLVKERRIWVVWGDTRHDWRQRLEAAGGRIVLRHHLSRMDVLLFDPPNASAAAGGRQQ